MLSALLLSAASAGAAPAESQPLNQNPSFHELESENVARGWTNSHPSLTQVRAEDGNRFVRLSSADAGLIVRVQQDVKVEPSVRLVMLSAKMRLANFDAGTKNGAALLIWEARDKDGKILAKSPDMRSNMRLAKNTDWETLAFSTAIPAETDTLRVYPGLYYAAGTLDIDDVTVAPFSGTAIGPVAQPATRALSDLPVVPAEPTTGAAVDESKVSVTYTVSPDGDDRAIGDQTAPFATLAHALDSATAQLEKGNGVRIRLAPGIYRQGEILIVWGDFGTGAQQAPLVIEGTEPGKVILSGSDVAGWEPATWNRLPDTDGIYFHDLTLQPGLAPNPGSEKWTEGIKLLLRRNEMVYLNGRRLDQQLPLAALTPGSFFVDDEGQRIYMRPTGEILQETDLIEVAVRQFLLDIRNKDNLVIRNITFTHAASWIMDVRTGARGWGSALRFYNTNGNIISRNLLIENCAIDGNNAAGINIGRWNGATFRNVTASYNGWKGIGVSRAENVLIEDTATIGNCWRAKWGDSRGLDAAGVKIIPHVSRITVRGLHAAGNASSGLWFDGDNVGVVVENCLLENNAGSGLTIEATPGPMIVRSTVIRGNAAGLNAHGAARVIVENSAIYDNKCVLYTNGSTRRIDNWILTNEGWTIRNNYLACQDDLFWPVKGWTDFMHDLTMDGNTYYTKRPKPFVLADGKTKVDFAGWREQTGHDGSSVLLDAPRLDDPRMQWDQAK